jgi:hypothetical protein
MKWVRDSILKIPSFSPFLEHVDIIERNVISNPSLCVETCKTLIEGICKTILTNKKVSFSRDGNVSSLVHQTISSTLNENEVYRSDVIDLCRRIAGVSDKLSQLRNSAGFASHGMDVLNPRLTETIGFFALRITDTITGFMLTCYNVNREVSVEHRIHYEDCTIFNEYYDDLNPMPFGLSTSLALFQQDFDAYKAAYYEHLNYLVSEAEDLVSINDMKFVRNGF